MGCENQAVFGYYVPDNLKSGLKAEFRCLDHRFWSFLLQPESIWVETTVENAVAASVMNE